MSERGRAVGEAAFHPQQSDDQQQQQHPPPHPHHLLPAERQQVRPEQQVTSGFGLHSDAGMPAYDNQANMNSELIRQVERLSGTPPLDHWDAGAQQALQNLLFGARSHEGAATAGAAGAGDASWNANRTLQDLASILPPSFAGNLGPQAALPPLSHGGMADPRLSQLHDDPGTAHLGGDLAWGLQRPQPPLSGQFSDSYGGVPSMDSMRGMESHLGGGGGGGGGARGVPAMPDIPFDSFAPQQQQQQQQQLPQQSAPKRGMHGIASPAAAAGPPAAGGCTVLAAKVLTESDVKHSRAILPRIAVENNLPFVVGFRTFGLLLPDQVGNEWEFVIKSWANGRSEKSGQTRRKDRRVYVVEQLSAFLAKHGLGVGNIIGIVLVDGACRCC